MTETGPPEVQEHNCRLLRRPRVALRPNARNLLNRHDWRSHRGPALTFCFLVPFLVGRALPRGDLVEGVPFCFHPHVGVAREHGARYVSGDAHDHLVTRARLRKLRYQRVPVVVLQKSCAAVNPYPCREPGGDHPHSLPDRTPWNPHPPGG